MKQANFILKHKFIIYILFAFILAWSLIAIGDVKTNYDMTKYLPDDSTSTIDLRIVEGEMSDISTISLMVKVSDTDELESIKESLKTIDEISLVNIDKDNPSNYKDGYALYTLIIEDGDSSKTKAITSDIEELLGSKEYYLGGSPIKSVSLEDSISSELILIVVFGFSVVFIVLFFTTKTYLEPIAIMFVIGIAIVINLGTNIIFPDISYVTKSTSAILQLGLSMDYTIIILHNYYREKQLEQRKEKAMAKAMKNSFKTVLSSSFTTIIGLLALVFMSFTIGTDLGLVLAKGIALSLITSFTLLPSILVLVDKIPFNKSHKTIQLKGVNLAFKKYKHNLILSIGVLVLVIGIFFIQTNNQYVFTEQTKYSDTEKISEVFGENNTFIIGFDTSSDDLATETLILDELNKEYEANITSFIGKSNTSDKDMNKTSILEVLDQEQGELLLGYYYAYNNSISITYQDFTDSLTVLLSSYPEYGTSDTTNLLFLNSQKDLIMNNTELYNALVLTESLEDSSLNEELVKANYKIKSININSVSTNVKVYEYVYAVESLVDSTGIHIPGIEDIDVLANDLRTLQSTEVLLNAPTNSLGFQTIAATVLGVTLDITDIDNLYTIYNNLNGQPIDSDIAPIDLMNFLNTSGALNEDQVAQLDSLNQLLSLINSDVNETTVNGVLSTLLTITSEEAKSINNSEELNLIVISSVLDSKVLIPDLSMSFRDAMLSLSDLALSIPEFSSLIDAETKSLLNQTALHLTLLESDTTFTVDELNAYTGDNSSTVLVYGNYAKDNCIDDLHVTAEELLSFINTQTAYTLNDEESDLVDDYLYQISISKQITSSENLNLIILNTSIPLEGEETNDFIKYIRNTVFPNVSEETYLVGNSVSNMEISEYFQADILKINFITIAAILVIIGLTFKSFIIPFLLVFTIEGAIWTNLSSSAIFAQPMFFIVYIIITAIQLGATIDYAILLTNSYRKHRLTKAPSIAIRDALGESSTTIITSGIMLIIAGFTIYFISSQASINTVGLFIGKGTIISIIYVLFLLPGILVTFDKFVVKKKKIKN